MSPGLVSTKISATSLDTDLALLPPFLSKGAKELAIRISWDAETAASSEIYLAVGKRVREEGITGRYYVPIATHIIRPY